MFYMEMKRRVVVVGLGSIGRRHARLLNERTDVEVELCEPSVDALEIARKEIGDLRNFDTYDKARASSPDIIWLATPTQFHAEQAIAALDAGCHVFCEKPMADSVENAVAMKHAADASGRIFNIGFMLHFMPAMRRLRELVTSGTLGDIVHIHARVGTYITLVNSLSRYQAANQGSLFLDYAHQPDLFYWLTGKIPTSVLVSGFQSGSMELSSDPNVAIAAFDYPDAMIGTIHLNYVQMPQRHDYEIVGSKAWASLDFETGEIRIGTRATETVAIEHYTYERDDLYRAQIDSFLKAVDGQQQPETSAADGIVSTKICCASIESYRSGGVKIAI